MKRDRIFEIVKDAIATTKTTLSSRHRNMVQKLAIDIRASYQMRNAAARTRD
ncbi:hypothetical protein [Coleofasciculus sp. FACHB-SPT36]|uniref:hypothetical protein n=1 Tax=Cyanophyceae TaxID=3028117 RepID=UPI00168B230E|nr:hypothetical protein [Coleofasciculus sp. FACHB-SPT36]